MCSHVNVFEYILIHPVTYLIAQTGIAIFTIRDALFRRNSRKVMSCDI